MAKKYFAMWNLEVVRNMELQLLFCPALSHTVKRRSLGSFCWWQPGHVYCSRYGGCKKVIRQRNFFTENQFIISALKMQLILRGGPIRRKKLCKGDRPSLKNSYPHLTFLFSPSRDHFQGISNPVIHKSIGQIQPFHGLLVGFRHPEQMNIWQHLRQGLQWVEQRANVEVS